MDDSRLAKFANIFPYQNFRVYSIRRRIRQQRLLTIFGSYIMDMYGWTRMERGMAKEKTRAVLCYRRNREAPGGRDSHGRKQEEHHARNANAP